MNKTMPSEGPSVEVPGGFKTWGEFNKAKKERRKQKQDYKIKIIEKRKKKELEASSKKEEVCQEPSTLSIAVPGSILDNAQSAELRTYLAGQIARAACVFKVDEIIVYDDVGIQDNVTTKTVQSLSDSGEVCPARRCCAQLARILQYLECPQYLRKEFFPWHKDLEYAGLLNPLDSPHHMRQEDNSRFREGVVLVQPARNGSLVNVGLLQHAKVDIPLQPGIRVTVEMLPTPTPGKRLFGKVVPPSKPRKETGVYWGYSVRLAKSVNTIFTECPYKEGYDVTIGTSERGNSVETVSFRTHRHALVVFGGLAGIESALEADDILTVDNPALLFDHYVNTCPEQGSRTIRTEEAILITLAELRTKLKPKVSYKIDRKEIDSEDDIATDGSDYNSEIENNLEGNKDIGEEENSFKTVEDPKNSSTSESCNENSEIKKVKKRKKSEGSSQVEEDLISKPKKIKSISAETLNNTVDASSEFIDSDAQMPKKAKKKKKTRESETSLDETTETLNSTVLTENGSSKSKKSKKKKEK